MVLAEEVLGVVTVGFWLLVWVRDFFSSGQVQRNGTFSLSQSLTGGHHLENTLFSLGP